MMSKIATSRSCSMLELPRLMEAWSSRMAVSRDLELGSTGGSNMAASRRVFAARVQADGHGPPMRIETLGASKRHGRRCQACQRVGVELQDRRALHEIEHAEARREAGATCRRQHVIGTRHIVADH